jgi:pilus assembly protein CpaB
LIIAIIGLFLIAGGIFLGIRFLNVNIVGFTTQAPPTPVVEPKALVVFAANDIPAGTLLTEKDVTLSEIPAQFTPKDTITTLDNVVGKMTKIDLSKGQMVLGPNLANPTGAAYDVAYILDDKHVLMALPATDLMSHEAIIKRGDIVDILVSIEETLEPAVSTGETAPQQAPAPQQVTFTASQKLNITAMVVDVLKDQNGNAPDPETASRSQVTVQAYLIALDPQDALVLKYLKDKGGIFEFVIRAPTSSGHFDLTPVTSKFIKELYGLELLP